MKEKQALHNPAQEDAQLIEDKMLAAVKRNRKAKGTGPLEYNAVDNKSKGLLYGVAKDEHNPDELNQLAVTDAQIDESFDVVGAQLDGIFVHEQGDESRNQVTVASSK